MRDFEDSTLWRISEFERMRLSGSSGYARLEGPSMLPSTLLQDLQHLEFETRDGNDVLEVTAACVRHREAALLYLQHDGLVWPLTLFPAQMLYHAPRELAGTEQLGDLSVMSAEPPGVRPPGHWMHERVAQTAHYRPLRPLLWMLALKGPRSALLAEIGGTAAYRAVAQPLGDGLVAPGALGPAVERLRREAVALRTLAGWPGMSIERASRLLNALYLVSSLVVTRTHHAARDEPGLARRWLGALRGRH